MTAFCVITGTRNTRAGVSPATLTKFECISSPLESLLWQAYFRKLVMPVENATPSSSTPKKPTSSNMPPGMIMGADGKPCKICTAFRNWTPGKINQPQGNGNRPARNWPAPSTATGPQQAGGQRQQVAWVAGLAGITGAVAAAATSDSKGTATDITADPTESSDNSPGYRSDEPPPGCPPDVEQLGRATWTFLHTTAAYFPDKPTPVQRANMLMLLRSLPIVYPCTWCATDFGENIEKHKPDVSSRVALSRWLCERHNDVNEKLGKDKFDCAKVDERWKDGPPDGSCD